jgi:hypothetical protein
VLKGVVTLYLLPTLNAKLIPHLEKPKPGSRIVSRAFDMKGIKADRAMNVISEEDGVEGPLYLRTTPLKKQPNKSVKKAKYTRAASVMLIAGRAVATPGARPARR